MVRETHKHDWKYKKQFVKGGEKLNLFECVVCGKTMEVRIPRIRGNW